MHRLSMIGCGLLVFAAALLPAQEAPRDPIQNSLNMKLVLIPAGEFMMGTDESAADLEKVFGMAVKVSIEDEKPRHRVRITKPFYLGIHEVTVGEFRAFVKATGYRTDAEKDGLGGRGWTAQGFARQPGFTWDNWWKEQTDRHPVVNVSWNDASAFCKWLSEKEGKTYRLPTEAEWEYACRAGTTTRFHSGDEPASLAKYANFADPKGKPAGSVLTTPVGSFQPNAFGLYDMHGNVWEFVADRYLPGYYAKSPVDDPPGPETGGQRAMRGACWGFDPVRGRSASRGRLDPTNRGYRDGFRVARDR
jgi:formylglycine-generating enzyme required for sulfatase activity